MRPCGTCVLGRRALDGHSEAFKPSGTTCCTRVIELLAAALPAGELKNGFCNCARSACCTPPSSPPPVVSRHRPRRRGHELFNGSLAPLPAKQRLMSPPSKHRPHRTGHPTTFAGGCSKVIRKLRGDHQMVCKYCPMQRLPPV